MTTGAFSDHFSDAAEGYRAYRPTYPDELFVYLTGLWGDPSKAKAVEWPLSVRLWTCP